jgi:NADH-quinone oxidoreductase subunit E
MALTTETREQLLEIVARYPQPRSALLPMLHLVQAEEGYVTPDGIALCADVLGIATAEVAAVATFYTMYKRRPVGDYHVGVCTNTLCAVMGGDAIFGALKEHLGVGNDETTQDGRVTLEHIECNAACDFAPVMTVNWEFVDNATVESAKQLVDDLRAGQPVSSTRGPVVRTFREVERVLAGFPDGLAHEGVAAGPATLAGLALAHELGQTAPGDEAAKAKESNGGKAKPAAAETAPSDDVLAAGESSAHDAPATTSASDPDHPAAPVTDAAADDNPAKED